MVALVVGMLVVSTVFTIGGASARHFQEQQRVGQTQRSVRMAMDRIRQDVSRAGFMGVPDTVNETVCPQPALPRRISTIGFTNDDVNGNTALNAMGGGRGTNGVSADELRLVGNYATGDSYMVRSFSAAGNVVFLQTGWMAFRRSFFVRQGAASVVDTGHFTDVFRPGRMLHIRTRTDTHLFVHITASAINAAGNLASITINPGIGAANFCFEGLGRGSTIAPLSEIRYSIQTAPAASNLAPRNAVVTGPNTQLIREELNMASGAVIAGSRRVILDYAVDFNLGFIIDTNIVPGNPPNIQRQLGAVAQNTLTNSPWQARGVIASIAARSAEQDPSFPWPDTWGAGRPAAASLNRFKVFAARDGAARVRSLTTEIQMPNQRP